MYKIFKNYSFIFFLFFTVAQCQFGKNIVQYEEFEWHYIKTKHFNIYYCHPQKIQAEFVANYSEEAFNKISQYLGWTLNEKSDIIIYNSHNDFQQTNIIPFYLEEGIGGVTEGMKNRMIIPYDGSLKKLKDVIYHELVHVFINDGIYGNSFKDMLTNRNLIIPLWMNEGLAEYLSFDWNAESDMWMRDIAINYPNIPEIQNLTNMLAYRGGQSVWKFITDKWGDEIIAIIFKNIKSLRSVNKGIEKSLNINVIELSNQWHRYLKQEYWPDIASRDNIQDIAFPLTNHLDLFNNYNILPKVSPDKSKVAIYSDKNGEMSIHILSMKDGKFLSKIATAQISSKYEELHILQPGITWSPDGNHIAFTSKSGKNDALYIVDLNKKNNITKKIFNIESIYEPSWNPKYNKIAFIGYKDFASDIFTYNIDTDELKQLTNDLYTDSQVSWSKNGEELLFVSDRNNNLESSPNVDLISITGLNLDNNDIYKLDSDSKITRLTNTDFNESYPTYSPNGKSILYISDEYGINNICITKDEFQSSYYLTNVLTGVDFPSWVTDNQIIFSGFYKGGYDIFILSDINKDINANLNIQPAQWKINSSQDLNIENSEINNKIHDFRHFEFSYENIQQLSSNKDNNENYTVDFLDSLGLHKSFKYKTKLELDYAGTSFHYDIYEKQAQGFGVFLFSDMLGDHKLNFQTSLVIDIEQSDIILDYINLKKRFNWGITFNNNVYPTSMYRSYELNDYEEIEEVYDIFNLVRDLGLTFKGEYPFSKFSRIETNIAHIYLEKKQLLKKLSNQTDYTRLIEKFNLTESKIKYVWDNARYLSGNRTYIEYTIAPNFNKNNFQYNKLSLDSRSYFKLSYKSSIMLASRLFLGSSWGKNPRLYGIGGAGYDTFFHSDDELINPIYRTDIMQQSEYLYMIMNNFQFPVRGYNIAQKFGTHAMILNLELRLPFLIYYFPAIKYLGQMYGVFFIDTGVTWNDQFPKYSNIDNWDLNNNDGWIMSYGIGPRFILFGQPWKLDYAWQYNPHNGETSNKNWYLSIGIDY